MTDLAAYQIMETDEQVRTDRPAYPFQPLRGLRYLPGILLDEFDFDPLPESTQAGGSAPSCPTSKVERVNPPQAKTA